MKDFNGGYIAASQEAYDLLVAGGAEGDLGLMMELEKWDYICVVDSKIHDLVEHWDNVEAKYGKQFYINNHKLSWDEPSDEEILDNLSSKEWEQIGDNAVKSLKIELNSMEDLNELPILGEDKMETISIKDNNGKEYLFEKPEFKCELIKTVGCDSIIGTIANYNAPSVWSNNGRCRFQAVSDRSGNSSYNLTPIKPKWYEDESNFPALMIGGLGRFRVSHDKTHALETMSHDNFRLATKEELNSLHYEGKQDETTKEY